MTTVHLTQARLEQHLELDDVADAVRARMDRQQCLNRPDARWLFLLEEDVLWYWPGPGEVHREQLRHLLVAMRRPTVSLGIIPRGDRRGVSPEESFTLVDTELAAVELVSGTLTVTHPDEVRLYTEAWERLWSLAVHGDRARVLIGEALEVLDPRS